MYYPLNSCPAQECEDFLRCQLSLSLSVRLLLTPSLDSIDYHI